MKPFATWCFRRFFCLGIFLVSLLLILLPQMTARADIAPPTNPPGSNPLPERENTQVRMESEQVLLEVQEASRAGGLASARVTAAFQMRNLGDQAETMQVRFPLSFWNGQSDGFGNFPEIHNFRVKVQGKSVAAARIETPNPSTYEETPIPWATFDVTFPVGQEVEIVVQYLSDGYGNAPFVAFNYVLETGAGWKDTIGQADLVVRLPYEANSLNVILETTTGFSTTTPGSEFDGQEVRWHFEDFEPGSEDNLEISLVTPSTWQSVLKEQQRVKQSPQDGEAWGRLGKLYKEVSRLRRETRSDEGGQQLYRLSNEAYEKAVTLKPNDSLWYYGYADLLWFHYFWHSYYIHPQEMDELVQAVNLLRLSLQADPHNERAQEMLDTIGGFIKGVVVQNGEEFDYLILTATPQITLPFAALPTATPVPPSPTPTQIPTETFVPVSPTFAPTRTNTPAAVAAIPPSVTDTETAAAQISPMPTPFSEGEALPGRGCGSLLFVPLVLGLTWRQNQRLKLRQKL